MPSRAYLVGAAQARLRRTAPGRMFWHHFPWRTKFSDGVTRRVPFGIHRLFRLWLQEYPGLAHESSRVFDAYRGGDFLDIGAFHGWYSLLLAPKAAPGNSFVAVEPDPQALAPLLQTLTVVRTLFPQLSLSLIDKPMGDGGRAVRIQPGGEKNHPSFRSVGATESGCPMLTVDELVGTLRLQPKFIKVGVEGAEHSVLRGMGNTLAKFRPMLMLEVHPEWLPAPVVVADVFGLLDAHGYTREPIDDRCLLCSPRHP